MEGDGANCKGSCRWGGAEGRNRVEVLSFKYLAGSSRKPWNDDGTAQCLSECPDSAVMIRRRKCDARE